MYKNRYNFILAIVGAFAIALGVWGFSICDGPCKAGSTAQVRFAGEDRSLRNRESYEPNPVKRVMKTLDLVRGHGAYDHPWQLVIAQLALPCVALLAAAQLFLLGLRRDLRVFLARHKRNHTIVCGLGDVGTQIVRNLRKSGHEIVAIDLNVESPNAASLERDGVPVLKGNAKNPEVIAVAGIRKAQMVVVCTGSDAVNVDIALGIQKMVEASPGDFRQLTVLVELRDEWLFSRLINHDKKALSSEKVELRFFNSYAMAARMLVAELQIAPVPELAANTFAIVGFGSSGRESALHLLRAFPVPLGARLKFIVFDENAEKEETAFQNSYPAAMEAAEFEFVTASLKVDTVDLKTMVEPKLQGQKLLGIAVCLPTDEEGLFVALELRSLLDRMGHLGTPVYLYMEQCRRLGDFAADIEHLTHVRKRLSVFGTFDELLSPKVLIDQKLDLLARAFHEAYRNRSKHEINPKADVPWHELPEFMKMSNRWRADHLPAMFALAGFHLQKNVSSPAVLELTPDEIELLSEYEHRRYIIERRLLEWAPGETRHHGHRRAPHLIEWASLSDSQKKWNRDESARLPETLASLGIELQRERKIHAYGPSIASATEELERAIAEPGPFHYAVIADFDEPEARRIAERAVSLPSYTVWLTSRQEQLEFLGAQTKDRGC